jgi:hypothetical protein
MKTAVGCCSVDELPEQLNDRQRNARSLVGVALLGTAVLAGRRSGLLAAIGAGSAGWFGASHLVAARTGYAGCPELGAIPSVILRRDVQIGCIPWRVVDRGLGLTA